MRLETLIAIAENGPWCGTRPPGRPRLHPSLEAAWDNLGSRPESPRHQANLPGQEVFGPEPDPWRLGTIEVGLYGAITLYQTGSRLSGAVAEDLCSAALVLFDETCGSMPPSELIWLLLHRAPPLPPPWLRTLTFAGEMLGFAQIAQHHELARMASHQIALGLATFGLQVQSGPGRAAA